MAWQPLQRPLIAAVYALNLGVRARRAVIRRRRRHGTAVEIIRAGGQQRFAEGICP